MEDKPGVIQISDLRFICQLKYLSRALKSRSKIRAAIGLRAAIWNFYYSQVSIKQAVYIKRAGWSIFKK